ncbi:hypothetical protein Ocin01_11967 [Orchesella cincta]|uniref:Uncharacterized protein n=1 Tax=Orchesella cincta TaxID=48709 RepID=A0A1D2MPC0_ORCCI|nr:hypothetical protein Ocin01_11967 [Orchesella cincta]
MYPRTSLEFRPRNVLIFTILAISCLQIAMISSQVIDCPRLIMRVAKGIIRVYGGCSKDFLISLEQNLKEYQRRVDCVMRCTMERIGLLNEFNKVTNDTVQVFFDKFLPEDYHEIGHIFVEGCTDEYAPLMDNEDDTCTAFGDFIRCVQNVIAEAC